MKETKRESQYLIAKRAFLSARSVTLLVTTSIIFFFLSSDYFDVCSASGPITPRYKGPLSPVFFTSSALYTYVENYDSVIL